MESTLENLGKYFVPEVLTNLLPTFLVIAGKAADVSAKHLSVSL